MEYTIASYIVCDTKYYRNSIKKQKQKVMKSNIESTYSRRKKEFIEKTPEGSFLKKFVLGAEEVKNKAKDAIASVTNADIEQAVEKKKVRQKIRAELKGVQQDIDVLDRMVKAEILFQRIDSEGNTSFVDSNEKEWLSLDTNSSIALAKIEEDSGKNLFNTLSVVDADKIHEFSSLGKNNELMKALEKEEQDKKDLKDYSNIKTMLSNQKGDLKKAA